MTNSSAFVDNDGALDTGNLLQKADGEITLVERDDQTLDSVATLAEDIATDELYILGDKGVPAVVRNSGVASANNKAVITKTTDFSIIELETVTGKTIVISDTENNAQTVTIVAGTGTIEVTGANGGTVEDNETSSVTITGVRDGVITYSFTAGAAGADTITVNATDGVVAADEKVTAVTVTAVNVLPTLDSAERLANTTVRVTLSEAVVGASITKANDGGFVVYETGTPGTTYAVSSIAPNGGNTAQVDLTVADMTASAAAGVTVTYIAGGNGTVVDSEGGVMATDAIGVNAAAWA